MSLGSRDHSGRIVRDIPPAASVLDSYEGDDG